MEGYRKGIFLRYELTENGIKGMLETETGEVFIFDTSVIFSFHDNTLLKDQVLYFKTLTVNDMEIIATITPTTEFVKRENTLSYSDYFGCDYM